MPTGQIPTVEGHFSRSPRETRSGNCELHARTCVDGEFVGVFGPPCEDTIRDPQQVLAIGGRRDINHHVAITDRRSPQQSTRSLVQLGSGFHAGIQPAGRDLDQEPLTRFGGNLVDIHIGRPVGLAQDHGVEFHLLGLGRLVVGLDLKHGLAVEDREGPRVREAEQTPHPQIVSAEGDIGVHRHGERVGDWLRLAIDHLGLGHPLDSGMRKPQFRGFVEVCARDRDVKAGAALATSGKRRRKPTLGQLGPRGSREGDSNQAGGNKSSPAGKTLPVTTLTDAGGLWDHSLDEAQEPHGVSFHRKAGSSCLGTGLEDVPAEREAGRCEVWGEVMNEPRMPEPLLRQFELARDP